jgi:hypothetical protein
MTRYQRLGNFLLFTRAGQAAAFLAGAACWFVAAPVLIPLVATAVLCDAIDSRRSKTR